MSIDNQDLGTFKVVLLPEIDNIIYRIKIEYNSWLMIIGPRKCLILSTFGGLFQLSFLKKLKSMTTCRLLC